MNPATPARSAQRQRYLMCRPTHFEVTYSINPWMDPAKPVDRDLAVTQWEQLADLYRQLGHQVEEITPLPGYPDMVYAANGATVADGRVLGARFRNQERAAEGPAYLEWFRANGYTETHDPVQVNEGEGDLLVVGDRILAGTGFRSSPESHAEAQEFLGRPVVGLRLVDPFFYHLDTALTVLTDDEVMYYPGAFSPGSRAVLERLYPDAIQVSRADAEVFGLNAVSDGLHVVLPEAATAVATRLRERGFTPIGVDLSELFKGGGSVKCCTLRLRD
ncbi:dimethylargininase [Streptacidiphilus albus]|uniref:dimethylargininase n=1 Tax=Streptacidiphilus albus TaxID=105425 RepID=UPI00054B5BBF|nr:dimethylargininase [Streptacidiphilus albus]